VAKFHSPMDAADSALGSMEESRQNLRKLDTNS